MHVSVGGRPDEDDDMHAGERDDDMQRERGYVVIGQGRARAPVKRTARLPPDYRTAVATFACRCQTGKLPARMPLICGYKKVGIRALIPSTFHPFPVMLRIIPLIRLPLVHTCVDILQQ